jgi:hypothetical protein
MKVLSLIVLFTAIVGLTGCILAPPAPVPYGMYPYGYQPFYGYGGGYVCFWGSNVSACFGNDGRPRRYLYGYGPRHHGRHR